MVKISIFLAVISSLALWVNYAPLNKNGRVFIYGEETQDKLTNQVPLNMTPSYTKGATKMGKEMMILANNSIRLENIISLPWGLNGGIPERFVGTIHTSIITNKPPRKMRAPVKLRVYPWNEIDILAYNQINNQGIKTKLYRFSKQGRFIDSIEISPPQGNKDGWRIWDFLVDETGHIYLLENYRTTSGTQNYLRKLTSQGQVIWEHRGSFSSRNLNLENLEGDFRQLLIDENSVPYLAATRHRGVVARINRDNGSLEPYADWGNWTGEVFMDGKGKLHYVSYSPETQTRCWANYNPSTETEDITQCDQDLYKMLAIPIAVDSQGRGYSVSGMTINRVTDGSLTWQERIDNLILEDTEDAIYIGNFQLLETQGELHVRQWDNSGLLLENLKLVLPSNLEGKGGALVYLDTEGQYYVFVGETATEDATLLVYSSQGILQDEVKPAPEIHLLEDRLQAGRSWTVDLEGNVYLPLLGSKGLHIIKLTPPPVKELQVP